MSPPLFFDRLGPDERKHFSQEPLVRPGRGRDGGSAAVYPMHRSGFLPHNLVGRIWRPMPAGVASIVIGVFVYAIVIVAMGHFLLGLVPYRYAVRARPMIAARVFSSRKP